MQLCICDVDKKEYDGYFLKFDSLKECNIFLTKINSISFPSSSTINRSFDDISSISSGIEKTPTKNSMNTTSAHQSQWYMLEYSKLIIYFQGVKLKEYNINKAQDLLGKIGMEI
jgi:hypothetical protein